MKRAFSFVLLVLLIVSLLGTTAFAAGYSMSDIDSYVGTNIVDFDYTYNKDAANKNYQPYLERYTSKAKPQCVGYVYARLEEKLNVSPGFASGPGAKDIPENAPDGKVITSYTTGKSYTIRVYKNDNGSHIASNSFVSFGAVSNNPYGHVIYVEEVKQINGTKYIYYTEGGGNYYTSGSNGTLKKLSFEKFISSASGGAYVGTVVFEATAPSCPHVYNNKGVCTSCGEKFPYSVVPFYMSGTVKNCDDPSFTTVNLKEKPYAAATTTRPLKNNSPVLIVAKTVNHYGNVWYKTSQEDWIYNKSVIQSSTAPSNATVTLTPPRVTVSQASSTTAKVSWNAVSGADYYVVEYKSPNTNNQWVVDKDYGNNKATSYTPGNMGNHTYYFRVLAANLAGQKSDWSNVASYTHVKETTVTLGKVTIRYNANGGDYAPDSHNVAKDDSGIVSFTLSTQKAIRSGYTFLGWRLENDTAYGIDSPGDRITFDTGSAASNDILTYYAQWETTDFTITYDANGGVGAPPSEVKTERESFIISSIVPSRDGYVFAGWAVGKNASGGVYEQGDSIPARWGDLVLYATWRKIPQETTVPPEVVFYELDSGWIGIVNEAVGGNKYRSTVIFGCKFFFQCKNHAIEEYGIILLDSGKRPIATEKVTPKTSAETYIKQKIPIYETILYSYSYDPTYTGEKQGPELIGNHPILANLEKGKNYYWYVYVISDGQRIESDMQSFVFEPRIE